MSTSPGRLLQDVSGDDEPDCREVVALVQCYVDGECNHETAIAVAAHVARCPCCGEHVASFESLKVVLRRTCVADAEAVARLRAFTALLAHRRG